MRSWPRLLVVCLALGHSGVLAQVDVDGCALFGDDDEDACGGVDHSRCTDTGTNTRTCECEPGYSGVPALVDIPDSSNTFTGKCSDEDEDEDEDTVAEKTPKETLNNAALLTADDSTKSADDTRDVAVIALGVTTAFIMVGILVLVMIVFMAKQPKVAPNITASSGTSAMEEGETSMDFPEDVEAMSAPNDVAPMTAPDDILPRFPTIVLEGVTLENLTFSRGLRMRGTLCTKAAEGSVSDVLDTVLFAGSESDDRATGLPAGSESDDGDAALPAGSEAGGTTVFETATFGTMANPATVPPSTAVTETASLESTQVGGSVSTTRSSSFIPNEGYVRKMTWTMGSVLGSGSFGVVRLCQDVTSGMLMAVKVCCVTNRRAFDAAQLEYRIVQSLPRHNNVLQYLGTDVINDLHCTFMEYLASGSVLDFGGHMAILDSVAAMYSSQVLSALMFLHTPRSGTWIAHRDLKCDNILVDPSTTPPTLKIGDFGCAVPLSPECPTFTSIAGTPNFLAPEVCRKDVPATELCDVYSLGCAIVQMMTGQPPTQFRKVKEAVTAGAHPPQWVPPSDGMTEECVSFVQACLTVEAEGRPSAAELILHPWIAEATSTSASRVSMGTSTQEIG